MSKKIINVVAAAIEKDGKIFCAQRPEGKSLGGYWEFPGGKLEEGRMHLKKINSRRFMKN